jgi:phosphoribosylpyrophosphate synthetase
MELSYKIPAWSEKTAFEKAMTALFAAAAAVAALTCVYTVFVGTALWAIEEISISVLMITDALVRWKHCDRSAKIEMCVGISVMILALALMWL